MKNTLITLASVATLAASANGQVINWATLGADANTIASLGGQTFTDIGTTLGIADYVGIDLNLNYTFDGTGNQRFEINGTSTSSVNGLSTTAQNNNYIVIDGTLAFSFSTPVGLTFVNGSGLSTGETNFVRGNGSLTSTHTEAGLVLTDDSVFNSTSSTIVTPTITWSGTGTSFGHGADVGGFSAGRLTLTSNVPEPSSTSLLGLGALGLLARRKR